MTAIRVVSSILIVFFALSSCNTGKKKSNPVWSDLPEVTSLSELKQTDFAITLENPVPENKNLIYAPAFLYAWDEIRRALKSPIVIDDKNSLDFKLLNNSISHQNSLTDTEYTASAKIVDGEIIAEAFFNKTLPFEIKLQALDDPILFGATKVSAFGMRHFNDDLIKFTEILYYKDDGKFVLKLIPKDKQHEIILAKGLDRYKTLEDAVKLTNDLITEGKREQSNTQLAWKYNIIEEDCFEIPVIKFNIETNYRNLQGQSIYTKDSKQRWIEIAYQRTGLILNENGAVVESEALVVAVDTASAVPIITHPKKMIFDKPFLIIIKRADKTNPYFVMSVANAELMTRKQ